MARFRMAAFCSLALTLAAHAAHGESATEGCNLQLLKLPATLSGEFEVVVELGGQPELLVLSPFSVRAPGFQLLVQDETGALQVAEAPPPLTVCGSVAGVPESIVAGSLDQHGLHAFIRLDADGAAWSIEPADPVAAGRERGVHIVAARAGATTRDAMCGVLDDQSGMPPVQEATCSMPASLHRCELALDADYDYFHDMGSASAAMAEMETIINGVNAVYTADANLGFSIVNIIVRTSSNDPYSGNSVEGLLHQVEHEWNAHQCSVARDVVQLFSGANTVGVHVGLAYQSQACKLDRAYSVIEPHKASIVTFADQVALSAHELGHNWGAMHCDDGPCASTCGIMHGTPLGYMLPLHFDDCSKNDIWCMIASVLTSGGCLDVATPYPDIAIGSLCQDALSPCLNDPGPILPLPTVYLKGFGVTGATSVTYGGSITVPEPALVINYDGPYVSFVAPLPPALGVNTVTISNSCDTSVAASINYVQPGAPILITSTPNGAVGQTYTWTFAGKVGHAYFLLAALHPASTQQINGWPVMTGYSTLASGQLDTIGYGSYSLVVPSSFANLDIDSQVVSYFSGQGVTGSSNIVLTHLFPF